MKLRLTYAGPLFAQGKTKIADHKHKIRKALHPQLKRLWGIHPLLKEKKGTVSETSGDQTWVIYTGKLFREDLAKRHSVCGYNFVPLVSGSLELACQLDILLLRTDAPGAQILRSGDIDNRIKTLLDALRMPKDKGELGGFDVPDDQEKPFYCLLEDDSAVDQLSLTTDTLLEAVDHKLDINTARVVITVTLRPFVSNPANAGF